LFAKSFAGFAAKSFAGLTEKFLVYAAKSFTGCDRSARIVRL
jgi:hypothetical protein